MSHGEGVAIGMVAINRHAEAIGLSPSGSTQQLITMIQKFHLPIHYDNWQNDQLYHAITMIKKLVGTN